VKDKLGLLANKQDLLESSAWLIVLTTKLNKVDAMTTAAIYTAVHKNMPSNFCPYISLILINFQNSLTGTLSWQCGIKLLLQILSHPKRVATLYLVKYNFFIKTAQTEVQQRQVKRTWTEENVIMIDKLILSQKDQPQIYRSLHQIAQAGAIRIILFMAILVWIPEN